MTEIVAHRISLSIASEAPDQALSRREWIVQVPAPEEDDERLVPLSLFASLDQPMPHTPSRPPKPPALPVYLQPALTRPPATPRTPASQPPPLQLDSDLELIRLPLPDQPRLAPRAARFFWWGFLFPPLWIAGTLHCHPHFCPRPCPLTTSQAKNPNAGRRLRARLGRGEVGVGRTALVIIPGPASEEKDWASEQWNSLSESPAERFLGETGQSEARLEWLVSGHQDSIVKVEQNREERKWALRCLLALFMTAGMVVVIVVISLHVQRGSTTPWLGPMSDGGVGSGNGSLGGAASRSNRPI